MASCVRNIRTKNYQNMIIGFHVTVKNVRGVFLRHSVQLPLHLKLLLHVSTTKKGEGEGRAALRQGKGREK